MKRDQAPALIASSEYKNGSGQFLTFMLAGEEYGIEILRVQEIKGLEATTRIPNAQPHILGVMNLRGSIVPLIDLRRRFNFEVLPHNAENVVVVVKVLHGPQERTTGLIVDAVADVYRFDEEDIQPAPEMGQAVDAEVIRGLALVDEKMVILLDVDKVICFDDDKKDEMNLPGLMQDSTNAIL